MSSVIESLKEHADKSVNYIQIIDREARSLHLLNEQWFINWQDKINRISVK